MTVSATALTALAAASEQVELVAARVSRVGLEPASPAGDEVDISAEMVKLLVAKREAQAAIKLVQTADEITKHTLDILA